MKNKKKTIILSSIILGALVLTLGITYAIFTYNAESANQQLILGDIWMSYNETSTNIQLKDAMPQELVADDFIARGVLNPIMKEQAAITAVEYLNNSGANELTKCVSYLTFVWGKEEEWVTVEPGETYEAFCRGTGTNRGYDIYDHIDDYIFGSEVEGDLIDLNVMEYTNFTPNSDMENQVLGDIIVPNELINCIATLESSGFELLEGETAENFCKGNGTLEGLTYLEHRDSQSEFYVYTYYDFTQSNVVLNKNYLKLIDLPYFEFQVNGKNTYTEQDIKYEIVLNNSEYIDEDGIKTERIEDKFLKFSLVEINDLGPELVFHNRSYEDLTNKGVFTNTISNTDGTINRTYRLYMWIGDEVIIGGGEAAYDYDMETWNKIYASVRVDVRGDFIEKEVVNDYVPATDNASFKRLVNNQFQDTTYIDTDGTIYLSGTNEEVNYNYVWYSGKLWRITSINPDGTLKMITDGLMTTIAYGENNKFYTDGNTTSYIYQWLNQEFLPTLYNYENIIVTDAVWNASTTDGNFSTKLPVEGQEEVLVNASVGLLNSYEYFMSYENISYHPLYGSGVLFGYLDMFYDWWLLNPWYPNSSYICYARHSGGHMSGGTSAPIGVRPSIYLKSEVQFIGGNGTVDNPYRIKGDNENIEENITLINTRESGEYVKLSNDETAPTFRIVGTENRNGTTITKLVLNDFLRDTNDVDSDGNKTEVLEKSFGTTNSWSSVSEIDSTYWRGYLNSVWIKEIDPTYNLETGTFEMLDKGTYYLGGVYQPNPFGFEKVNPNYKITVCKMLDNKKSIQDCIEENTEETSTIQESINDYSGLLRYGEMFASQFGPGAGIHSGMWLITPASTNNSVLINNSGGIELDGFGFKYRSSSRPTINLKSNLVIKSGLGTEQDPFVVGLPS